MVINVVLVNPQIPWNTGNVGRTCVATNCKLHIVGNMGFSLDDARLKRAGLDYWEKLDWKHYGSFAEFEEALPQNAELFFFSKKARKDYWQADFGKMSYLVFGSEVEGIPDDIHLKYQDRFYRIPQTDKVRSLNLSTSAGIALFEALRQINTEKK